MGWKKILGNILHPSAIFIFRNAQRPQTLTVLQQYNYTIPNAARTAAATAALQRVVRFNQASGGGTDGGGGWDRLITPTKRPV